MCSNNFGSYTCSCGTGYTITGFSGCAGECVMKGENRVTFCFPQILTSALVIMVDVIKLVPTMLVATSAPVELDTHKMAFMDVWVCFTSTCCVMYNVCIILFPQILTSALLIMVVVTRRAPTTLVATPAPVELDTHKMAFMDVWVCISTNQPRA